MASGRLTCGVPRIRSFVATPTVQPALSQILVHWRHTASFPLSGCPLRGQGVELFGRTAALLTAPFKLPFTQHVYELNAG